MKKKRKRAKRPHVRIRYVDFQEISRLAYEKLDSFKKEVRDKLIQKSIRDLIKKELDEEERKRKIQATRRRRRYVKYARLTAKQRECYRMYHHAGNKKRKVPLQCGVHGVESYFEAFRSVTLFYVERASFYRSRQRVLKLS